MLMEYEIQQDRFIRKFHAVYLVLRDGRVRSVQFRHEGGSSVELKCQVQTSRVGRE